MKQTLKQQILQQRDSLSKKEIMERSYAIKNSLYSLREFIEAKSIMLYVSFNNEVDTQGIVKELLGKNGKTIVVPYVLKYNLMLQASELRDFNELEQRTFGILEPKDLYKREYNIDRLDLVIIPGVVFDRTGHRIGYGYGYYDRFLKTLRKETLKIGLAYDFQIVGKIPEEKHDVPMDIIITDKEVLRV